MFTVIHQYIVAAAITIIAGAAFSYVTATSGAIIMPRGRLWVRSLTLRRIITASAKGCLIVAPDFAPCATRPR